MKITKNIFLAMFLLVFFQSCEEDQFESSLDYVAFGDSTYSTGIDPGANANFDIKVYTSTTTGSDRSFNVAVVDSVSNAAAGSYVVPASVTIPSGSNEGTLTVELSDTNLDCFNDVVISFDAPEGTNPGPATTLTYFQNPSNSCSSEVSGTLDFDFDDWASEVSYQILDVLGGVVASGPDTSWADGTPSASIPITLCSGRCYTIIVNDAFADGLSSPGGSYTLTIGGTDYATDEGNYGASSSSGFQVN